MKWDICFKDTLNGVDALYALFIEIEAYRKSVIKLPIPPGLARKVNSINIVRQIRGTTGIEGNTMTESNIKEFLNNPQKEAADIEEQEVQNANAIIKFIREYKGDKTYISEKLIKDIHSINTFKCEYKDNIPGEYRRHQNIAGEYQPPRPEEVGNLMGQFIEFINSREMVEKYGPLVRSIVAHFYLVSIHPFGDGNGRTSRALEAFILYHAGYNTRGFYSLANYYYKHRREYIDELQKARFQFGGRLKSFIEFALKGFIIELEYVQEQIINPELFTAI